MKEWIIYPCDVILDGSCPKICQDCSHCRGWSVENYEDEPEELAAILKKIEEDY